ncbi:MAG: T9SS type A sorting domain-containing protein [Saprospiraceae bacterium]
MAVPLSVAPGSVAFKTSPRFRVYPNPARDAVTILCVESNAFDEIQIMDILGRVLVHRVVDPGQNQVVVPVVDIPEGFIVLHLKRGGEQVFSEMINIQR